MVRSFSLFFVLLCNLSVLKIKFIPTGVQLNTFPLLMGPLFHFLPIDFQLASTFQRGGKLIHKIILDQFRRVSGCFLLLTLFSVCLSCFLKEAKELSFLSVLVQMFTSNVRI